jgi:hypothetical protein
MEFSRSVLEAKPFLQHLGGYFVAQLDLFVAVVHKDQLRLVLGHIAFMNLGEGGNDEQIAHAGAAGSRTVDGNHARALALDGVGHEALAVVDIPDMDLFVSAMLAASSRSSSMAQEPS